MTSTFNVQNIEKISNGSGSFGQKGLRWSINGFYHGFRKIRNIFLRKFRMKTHEKENLDFVKHRKTGSLIKFKRKKLINIKSNKFNFKLQPKYSNLKHMFMFIFISLY